MILAGCAFYRCLLPGSRARDPAGSPSGSEEGSLVAGRLVPRGGSGSVSAGNGLSVEGEMIREHDLVVLKRDRKEAGLEKGDVGTVVLVYPGGGYIVEFVDHEGNTLAVLDLAEEEIAPLKGPALLRAKTS